MDLLHIGWETASEAQTGGTLSCMNQHTGAGNFAEQERSRVEAELADLRRRRDQMRAELRDDADTVGDRGDAADAIQRAEDLAGIDEQIARLTWLLAGGNTAVEGQLPNGTQVTIRFPATSRCGCGGPLSGGRRPVRRTPH